MDKLRSLQVLCAVAERASFTAAADALDLSNAAVSKNIRELEAELGVRLLNRTTRRVHLTAAGERYVAQARSILNSLAAADGEASDKSGQLRGQLRVTAPMSLGIAKIAAAAASFCNQHPQVRLTLELDDRSIDPVKSGCDLAIRGARRLKDSSLIVRKIAGMERVLCASAKYLTQRGSPSEPHDLSDHSCLVYALGETPDIWTFQRGKMTRSVSVTGPFMANNSIALVRAAARGLGLALVPLFTVEDELASKELVRVLPGWSAEPSFLWALVPPHRQESRAVRLFVEHLRGSLESKS